MLLKKLEQSYGIIISYSPSMTDTLYPDNTILLQSTDLETTLLHLLEGTNIDLKTIGTVYCLVEKKEKKKIETPVIVQIKRDSVRLPRLANQITLPDMKPDTIQTDLSGVSIQSLEPYKLPVSGRGAWSIRTNTLLLMTGSLNLGVNYAIRPQWSIGGQISYNPWSYGKTRIRHLLLRPEFRYWLCDNNGGHFLSGNIQYARYNVGGLPKGPVFSEDIQKNRYQGTATGAGMGYGYSWIIGNRLNLELEIGLGILYNSYTKYPCTNCGTAITEKNKLVLAPNKLALNLVYILK
ncbi:MAG: DUF3575 domain-containing protein [Bacteroidales bacterium]